MNIYLIRHTAVYNPTKLCYGQSEIPLEENFTIDFDWIKDHLKLEDALYYSSPFRRCTKLAAFLSNDNFEIDKRISELNFGDWEMKAWSDINPVDLNPWMEDFVNYRIKNGENFNDLFERSIRFFEEIMKLEKQNIVIVCHAGVIRSIISYILDFPLGKAFNLQVDYSSISKIKCNLKTKSNNLKFSNMTASNMS